jgi:hypothetical protein
MKPLLVLVLIAALVLMLASALKRANNDWRCQLRLILAFALLDALESPLSGPVLEEVRLSEPVGGSFSDELVLASAGSLGRASIHFHLGEPLDQRAQLCDQWFDEATPLLLAVDDRGAVLHGPDGCLLGDVEQRGWASQGDIDRDTRR